MFQIKFVLKEVIYTGAKIVWSTVVGRKHENEKYVAPTQQTDTQSHRIRVFRLSASLDDFYGDKNICF